MLRSELISFRVPPKVKALAVALAHDRSDGNVSGLLVELLNGAILEEFGEKALSREESHKTAA